MPVPTYDLFIEPVLRYLAASPIGVRARDVHDAAASALGLTEADRAVVLPSGVQRVYKNRAGWAYDRLKRAGLATSVQRGLWQLSEAGLKFARDNPSPLSPETVEHLATANRDIRLRPHVIGEEEEELLPIPVDRSASPDDRLESALSEIKSAVAAEILDLLSRVSPEYFESIVLDVLHRMGYGTTRTDAQQVGRSGDGGIDGVISLDRLGLEKVYVQAKRWQGTVGGPEVQAFYGALAGRRANKGVFISTSSYSQQAIAFAASVERVVLVDGVRLAGLMIEHQVGVSSRTIQIPRVDTDYFDE